MSKTGIRNFIIFFQGSNNTDPVIGDIPIKTSDNEYPSRNKLVEGIEEIFECTNVTFTNIIELSEKDYNNWKQ